jgi:hypothetical protein
MKKCKFPLISGLIGITLMTSSFQNQGKIYFANPSFEDTPGHLPLPGDGILPFREAHLISCRALGVSICPHRKAKPVWDWLPAATTRPKPFHRN